MSNRQRKPKKDPNVLTIAGRLTWNPRPMGRNGAIFGLAVHTIEMVEGERYEVAFFLDVKVVGPQAANCLDHLSTGREIVIPRGSFYIDEEDLEKGGSFLYWDEAKKKPIKKRSVGVITREVEFRSYTRSRKPKKDLNVLTIGGRLTNDPRPMGRNGAIFGLAVHTIATVEGERYEVAFFLNVKVFGPQAAHCLDYLSKGREILVEGGSLFVEEEELEIGGKVIFWDEKEERPIMLRSVEVITRNVEFRR